MPLILCVKFLLPLKKVLLCKQSGVQSLFPLTSVSILSSLSDSTFMDFPCFSIIVINEMCFAITLQ